MVVENVNGEKQHDVYQPSFYWDMIRLEEKRRTVSIELGQISSSSHEEELDEG